MSSFFFRWKLSYRKQILRVLLPTEVLLVREKKFFIRKAYAEEPTGSVNYFSNVQKHIGSKSIYEFSEENLC